MVWPIIEDGLGEWGNLRVGTDISQRCGESEPIVFEKASSGRKISQTAGKALRFLIGNLAVQIQGVPMMHVTRPAPIVAVLVVVALSSTALAQQTSTDQPTVWAAKPD